MRRGAAAIWTALGTAIALAAIALSVAMANSANVQQPSTPANPASILIDRVLRELIYGPSFDAKVRQRVWAAGREVIGVGSYEQAGQGSGQFNLQLTMHDGDGKHSLQQISDGKLAWTRMEVAGEVSLQRVNLGALNESTSIDNGWDRMAWRDIVGSESPKSSPDGLPNEQIPLRLRVGGIVELLDRVARDYELRLRGGKLEGKAVWILSGSLRARARDEILRESGAKQWGELCPSYVRVAVATTAEHPSGFGVGIPIRIEFWSDPQVEPNTEKSPAHPASLRGRLISLIELYSLQPITRPSPARFKFVNEEYAVQFTDETNRYE